MKITKDTIADIIEHGDSTTMYEVVRTLIRSLNDRDTRLKAQEQAAARMETLFAKTEADRDRFRRMAEGLLSLCKEVEQLERAQRIVQIHGGFGEPDVVYDSEITIELE